MIPDGLFKAAQVAAGQNDISYVAVYENCPIEDESLVRLVGVAEGVCAVGVNYARSTGSSSAETLQVIPFLWMENLDEHRVKIAAALISIGVDTDVAQAAIALTTEVC
jgi:hypothetical protein